MKLLVLLTAVLGLQAQEVVLKPEISKLVIASENVIRSVKAYTHDDENFDAAYKLLLQEMANGTPTRSALRDCLRFRASLESSFEKFVAFMTELQSIVKGINPDELEGRDRELFDRVAKLSKDAVALYSNYDHNLPTHIREAWQRIFHQTLTTELPPYNELLKRFDNEAVSTESPLR